MNKKILVIPDSFKGSMSSEHVAEIIADAAASQTSYEIVTFPIADGGEGSTRCIMNALGGSERKVWAKSPEGDRIEAMYGITEDKCAIIEIAEPCGLTKQNHLNPLSSNTFGFGEMILDALNQGIRKFFICLGGSATTDCGLGMATALGARFLGPDGKAFEPCGASLNKVTGIDMSGFDDRVWESSFVVMSDVASPLYGPEGAACVFAPQKGASPADVRELDEGLRHVSALMNLAGFKDSDQVRGAGAAGGTGYACKAFLGANIRSGIDAILDLCDFDNMIKDVDLIVTGEGKFDEQSLMGKVVGGIRERAAGKKMAVFTGICTLPKEKLAALNIDVVEIGRGISLEESLAKGEENLSRLAKAYFKEKEIN